MGEIIFYKAKDGLSSLDVRLHNETVWLSLDQIASLFDRDKSVISRHLRNIFSSGELMRTSVVAKNATTAIDGKTYQVEYYNLDAIISVGYRVNSIRGTEFRIWATQILKEHIVRGYTINQHRLTTQVARLAELQNTVDLISRVLTGRTVTGIEADGLLRVIADYSRALHLLDQYDHQQLQMNGTTEGGLRVLTYENAIEGIRKMAQEMDPNAGVLFGREKDKGLASAIGAVYQTFNGRDLYPSIEEKAAHLLYFVVKDHPFVDGNKRIGAFLFIWFLESQSLLYRKDGTKRLPDNALVALTLLMAESKPDEKDLMCKVVVNLINRENQ
jgi:prophage maintenance system killer protein